MTGSARPAAPRGVARRLGVLATTLLTIAACASAGPPPSTADGGVPPLSGGPTSSADRAAATELLTRARAAYDAGDYAAALSDADEVVARYPATPASSPALLLAARAALEMEDFDGAERRARRYAELFPGDAEGARPALDILEESGRRRRRVAEDPGRRALVLGVIVPESGSQVLERYGELVVQGATLAAEAFRAATERDVELRVRDDGADEDRAADLVLALESGGADAILGPLLSESLLTAAEARGDFELPIVSPTASDHPTGRPNAFTLNAPNALEAERLADYARERGFTRIALLYPRTAAHEYLAAAFRARLASTGMQPVLDIGYPEDKTTFRDVIAEMGAARAEVAYAPSTQRGVRQLAPQLAFLSDSSTRIAVLGNDVWAAPETLRLVEADALEGVVVATSDPRTVGSESYEAFVARYEAAYRRTLDNPFPALGYDATTLLLAQAAARQGGALAPGIEPGTWYRGATGAIGVRDGMIVRRPYLVRIEAGRAVVLDAGG
jgi:ABC-type branched-subunit amino acid transport system substrate-binding protein